MQNIADDLGKLSGDLTLKCEWVNGQWLGHSNTEMPKRQSEVNKSSMLKILHSIFLFTCFCIWCYKYIPYHLQIQMV